MGGFTAYKADALKFRKKLGDPWFDMIEHLNIPKEERDPKNPHIMSWYFSAIGISGTRGHDVERNKTVTDAMMKDFDVPYFLEPNHVNNATVKGRLEFFMGTKGSGVHPHTDPVCQWIFSGQTSGRKSWRLSLPYNIDELETANPGYKFQPDDGEFLCGCGCGRVARAHLSVGNQLLALMMNKR